LHGVRVTFEIIILALASTVRPTSLAAVYALLSTEAPRRLMTVYVIAGLVFTIAFGLLVIWAFNGVDINSGSSRTKGIAELAGGALVLVFARLLQTRRVGGPRPDDTPRPHRWDKLLEHRLTLRTATVAGPATHVPGLFYLVALNLIVAQQPKIATGLLEVLLYNAIWFLIPLGALVVCIIEPELARTAVGAIEAWTKRHTRTIIVAVAYVVGAALIVRGLITI
jgi:Sap, sulfolipid-1-addressing protein